MKVSGVPTAGNILTISATETRILKINSCLKQSIFSQIDVNTMKMAEHMVDWLSVHQFILLAI